MTPPLSTWIPVLFVGPRRRRKLIAYQSEPRSSMVASSYSRKEILNSSSRLGDGGHSHWLLTAPCLARQARNSGEVAITSGTPAVRR
jgi:hypothetical protein